MAKLDHRVPFPKAGKGFFLFFSLQALASIEEVYGEEYFNEVEKHVRRLSPSAIIKCIDVSLRNQLDHPVQLDWSDKTAFTMQEAGSVILEALSLSVSGKTYKELIAEAQRELDRQTKENSRKAQEAAPSGEDPSAGFVA